MNFVHKLQQDEKTALDALGELAQKDSTEAIVSGRRHGAGLAQSFGNEPELFGQTKYRGEKAAKQYNSSRKMPLSNKGSKASAREPEVDQQVLVQT
jgi:hypothetical protein